MNLRRFPTAERCALHQDEALHQSALDRAARIDALALSIQDDCECGRDCEWLQWLDPEETLAGIAALIFPTWGTTESPVEQIAQIKELLLPAMREYAQRVAEDEEGRG